jgi:GH25 family lysozyme M1 (1,4-beta-N-acetylmuramidase)
MGQCRRKVLWLLGLALGLQAGLVQVSSVAAGPTPGAIHSDGIDVSHYQGTVNWSSVRTDGVTFAITKATEGTSYLDPTLSTNIAGMKRAGIIPGAYHFAHPNLDATAQANYFTNAVRTANGGNFSGLLQLVLDLEVTDSRTPAQVWAWTQTFVARVQAVTGRPCIIYTGFYFWRDSVGNPTSNLNCPLWLAAYVPESQTNNLIPRAWSSVGWAFWQYTSTGRVPGVSGNVDRDYFKNTGSYRNINALRIP